MVITSGTLSPIDLYPRILNFNPVCCRSLNMTLTRCECGYAGGWGAGLLRLLLQHMCCWPRQIHNLRQGLAAASTSAAARQPGCDALEHHAAVACCMALAFICSAPLTLQPSPDPACRDCLCPVVLTRGADQMPVSTKFEMRNDAGVVRNYGALGPLGCKCRAAQRARCCPAC